MLKISVIIPVYNAKNYLERCLNSVCNQTLKDIEIICVNDCSTDNSLDILNDYSKKYPFLKVIDCKINGGESKARNIGLDNATGEYIAFVDNDDVIDLDFYEKLYNKAKETNADIVKGRAHIINYMGKESYDDLNDRIREFNSKLFFAYYWWTAIYSAELIKDNNIRFLEGYPLGGDVLFLNEAILKCRKLELLNDTCYHYYRREDSGDSKLLTTDKIHSVINIHERMINNIINTKIYLSDYNGAKFLVSWNLQSILAYPFRYKTLKNLEFCLKKAIVLYKKLPFQLTMHQDGSLILKIVLDVLKQGNYEELKNLYIRYDTQQKMFLANIRYQQIRKKYE